MKLKFGVNVGYCVHHGESKTFIYILFIFWLLVLHIYFVIVALRIDNECINVSRCQGTFI